MRSPSVPIALAEAAFGEPSSSPETDEMPGDGRSETGEAVTFSDERSAASTAASTATRSLRNGFFRLVNEEKRRIAANRAKTNAAAGFLLLRFFLFVGWRRDDADDDAAPLSRPSAVSPLRNGPTTPLPSVPDRRHGVPPLPGGTAAPRGASENIRTGGHGIEVGNDGEYNDDIDDCVLEAVITARYPPADRPDQPLTPMRPQFCHPQGADAIVLLHEYKMPTVHHFVLTDAKGGKPYGTCLTVYEEFTPPSEAPTKGGKDLDDSREEGQERGYVECSVNGSPMPGRTRRRSKSHKYYAPRVLCLLSTWPYLSSFRTYLTQLYRLATTTNLMIAPLERYILNICSEVPAPPPGLFEVKLSILGADIRFWALPADQPIPYVSLPYGVLFECLDIGNVLFAWYTLACERKILLVSSQHSLLTVCAEILCSMIFPMRWSHLYIPW